nr:radical SAM family heme chaperone HemW [Bacillota bacterium]
KEYSENYTVDTVFIGGGTPSFASAEQTERITEAIYRDFYVSEDAEITIEGNPNSLSREKLRAYKAGGINRLSMGVQSMDDEILVHLGRVHKKDHILDAYENARNAGFENINFDLMFGVPDQTLKQWENTVSEVIKLAPEHISFYSMQLEEGTSFCRNYKKGLLDLTEESIVRGMYHEALRTFKNEGYMHYEISNLARPGFQCRHNLKYWSFEEYLSAGLGASSYITKNLSGEMSGDPAGSITGSRFKNTESMETYLRLTGKGYLPIDLKSYHTDTIKESMAVYCFTALRKTDGINFADFTKRFGMDFFRAYRERADIIFKYRKKGLLNITGTGIALTEKGIDHSNDIMSEFV